MRTLLFHFVHHHDGEVKWMGSLYSQENESTYFSSGLSVNCSRAFHHRERCLNAPWRYSVSLQSFKREMKVLAKKSSDSNSSRLQWSFQYNLLRSCTDGRVIPLALFLWDLKQIYFSIHSFHIASASFDAILGEELSIFSFHSNNHNKKFRREQLYLYWSMHLYRRSFQEGRKNVNNGSTLQCIWWRARMNLQFKFPISTK